MVPAEAAAKKVSKVQYRWAGRRDWAFQGVREACTKLKHISKRRTHQTNSQSVPSLVPR